MLPEPIAVTFLVIEAFEKLSVPYFIGGSLACAVHGVSRSTMDADLVADLKVDHIQDLLPLLSGEFYLDEEAIRSAILRKGSFNLIHLETNFKVDIFIRKSNPFDEEQFSRRSLQVLTTDPERSVYVSSAEDLILAKLDWFRQGGEVSTRQWQDIINLLKVQEKALNYSYLFLWAADLGLSELLERSISDSNIEI